MDDGVKQRIVGAFVLLALGVIFVPVFFDRERMTPVDRTTQIPLTPSFVDAEKTDKPRADVKGLSTDTPAPATASNESNRINKNKDTSETLPAAEIKETNANQTLEPVAELIPTMPPDNSQPPDKMFIPKDNVPQSLEPVPPKLDSKGVPESWVLQVASFRFEAHAKQMRDDLIELGYRAYVREIDTSKGKMTRVYVGPKLDKARLLDEQKKIEEKYKLKAVLIKFEP